MKRVVLLLQLALVLAQTPARADDAPALQEIGTAMMDTRTEAELPQQKVLQGSVDKRHKRRGDDEQAADLKGLEPTAGATQTTIPLSASKTVDPDAGNAELQIEWDRWRNKFARAVWAKSSACIVGPGAFVIGTMVMKFGEAPGYHFPAGLKVTYRCEISNEGRITALTLSSSSGNRDFDNIILHCVRSTDGKRLLAFPRDSKRLSVIEEETLITGGGGWHGRTYNDVEHVSYQN